MKRWITCCCNLRASLSHSTRRTHLSLSLSPLSQCVCLCCLSLIRSHSLTGTSHARKSDSYTHNIFSPFSVCFSFSPLSPPIHKTVIFSFSFPQTSVFSSAEIGERTLGLAFTCMSIFLLFACLALQSSCNERESVGSCRACERERARERGNCVMRVPLYEAHTSPTEAASIDKKKF